MELDGKQVKKPYSPISDVRQTGTVDFVIKVYRPNEHPDFPAGGQLTPHFEKLQVGDKLQMVEEVGEEKPYEVDLGEVELRDSPEYKASDSF